jgi:hypothetical protein
MGIPRGSTEMSPHSPLRALSLASMELHAAVEPRSAHPMLSEEKQMEVLDAYDLTRPFRAAAADRINHHTVARYVKQEERAADGSITELELPLQSVA